MPDAAGRFCGISVPAEAHERIFGPDMHAHDHDWGQNPPASRNDPSCRCTWHTDGQPKVLNPDCPLAGQHVSEYFD